MNACLQCLTNLWSAHAPSFLTRNGAARRRRSTVCVRELRVRTGADRRRCATGAREDKGEKLVPSFAARQCPPPSWRESALRSWSSPTAAGGELCLEQALLDHRERTSQRRERGDSLKTSSPSSVAFTRTPGLGKTLTHAHTQHTHTQHTHTRRECMHTTRGAGVAARRL